MKCILLCAGYATRLYPLTLNTPKHLLKVGEKAILDYVIEKLPMEHIDQIYLVTNNKFYQNFVAWRDQLKPKLPIMVLNDQTMSNEDRLGSMGDVLFVIEQTQFDDDFLLISADNLFNFDLTPMLGPFFEGRNIVALYDVQTIEEAKKMGIPTLNSEGVITHLIEKPENPSSTLSSIGIYLFHREVIQLLRQYIEEGHSPDKVGDFISWLCQKIPLYTHRYDGPNDLWLDIGTPSQLELAKRLFAK
ncbi:MAG: nucleotidyltransferase family protein [candidate division KSB1 bacterium]|nr:nucleotidyltransferase family protein [candidate division KSB1 bacterium]MDZ7400830.1 nucleotidyltransferase family protein [candidate division KSB1 bacterium]